MSVVRLILSTVKSFNSTSQIIATIAPFYQFVVNTGYILSIEGEGLEPVWRGRLSHVAYRKDAKLTTHVNAELPDWASNC